MQNNVLLLGDGTDATQHFVAAHKAVLDHPRTGSVLKASHAEGIWIGVLSKAAVADDDIRRILLGSIADASVSGERIVDLEKEIQTLFYSSWTLRSVGARSDTTCAAAVAGYANIYGGSGVGWHRHIVETLVLAGAIRTIPKATHQQFRDNMIRQVLAIPSWSNQYANTVPELID